MNTRSWLGFFLVSAALPNLHGQALHLDVRSDGPGVELSWPGSLLLPSGRTVYPIYQLEQTTDWLQWRPAGSLVKARVA
jgi:hypothetical protein